MSETITLTKTLEDSACYALILDENGQITGIWTRSDVSDEPLPENLKMISIRYFGLDIDNEMIYTTSIH